AAREPLRLANRAFPRALGAARGGRGSDLPDVDRGRSPAGGLLSGAAAGQAGTAGGEIVACALMIAAGGARIARWRGAQGRTEVGCEKIRRQEDREEPQAKSEGQEGGEDSRPARGREEVRGDNAQEAACREKGCCEKSCRDPQDQGRRRHGPAGR